VPPSFVPGCLISTPEGSASVADRLTGALLFYTNGVTVWNANNQVMSNGTGLLGGTAALLSSTTAAVIVPKPGSISLFYIVTIDEQFNGNGVRYSVVDMTLNGGLGDIVAGQALAHVASAEGIICVEKISGHHPEALDYKNIQGCTYCNPEIASVGMTEKAAKEAGYEIKVGKFPFSASGKASAAGAKDGFVKVIFDAKYGEWLGCHMIGANVTEMIAEAVAARKLETTGHEIIKTVHPHPTMSEAVMEAAAAAYGEVIHL
jgi:hypothetical protein